MRNPPWSLLLQACFVQTTALIIRPASAYRALELGIGPVWLGLIAASFAVLPLLVGAFVGHFADGGHEQPLLILSAGLMVAAAVGLLVWSPSLTSLLLWNTLLGLGFMTSGVAQQTLVGRGDPTRADTNFGMYTFATSVGQTLAPLALMVLGGTATLPDTSLLFAAAVVCAGLAFLFAALTGGRSRHDAGHFATPARRRSIRQALNAPSEVRRQLFGAIGVSMVILVALDLLTVYLPAWGVEMGISAFTVGVLLTIRSLATMLSRLGLGTLVRVFGRSTLIIASMLSAAVTILLLMFMTDMVVVAVMLFIAGAALGIGQPLTMAIVSILAPPGTVGVWLSIRLTGNSSGLVVIPPVVGLVAGAAGASGVFGIVAFALLGAAGLSWAGRGRR